MRSGRHVASRFCKGLIAAALASLVIAAVIHDLELLRAAPVKTGAYPQMIYLEYAMPGYNVAGADFADIYNSANALRHHESAYRPTSAEFADPFQRPKNYPSLMYWLYVPLTLVSFWPALVVHEVASLLAVFGAAAFALWKARLKRYVGLVLFAQASLYFLTPVGVTHFERGQFDLLVAAMFTLCFACSFVDQNVLLLAALTGVAGALKWTSIPFLACFAGFGFLLSTGRRRIAFFVLPLLTLLSTVVFWNGLKEYWQSIRYFDLDTPPYGVTLRHYLSPLVSKLVPVAVALTLAIIALIKHRSTAARSQLLMSAGAPLALVLTNLSICYPAVSYEYHAVSALGMLPILVIWVERAQQVPVWIKAGTCTLYGIFLITVLRVIEQFVTLTPQTMTLVYMAFAGLFLGVSVYTILTHKFDRVPEGSQLTAAFNNGGG